jgi:hypothetical protein
MRVLGIGILVVFLCGCGSPFPPITQVDRLRILAIKAEPPEVGTSEETLFSVLVADPQGGGRELGYTFAVCWTQLGYEASDISCPGPDSYVIHSEGATARLSLPDLLMWMEEQGLTFPVEGIELPSKVNLLIGLQVEGGGDRVRAIKRLTVRLKEDGEPNRNPVMDALRIGDQLLGGDPYPVPAGQTIDLIPVLAAGSQQWFRPEGDPNDRLEDALFSWYSTAGKYSDAFTILDVDTHGKPLEINSWKAPVEIGPIQIWVVVHDGRFGEDWIERSIIVVPNEAPGGLRL